MDDINMFSIAHFMPHGHCYLWMPSILWLNVLSDAAIMAAYISIPITLLYFIRKRQDLPFSWVFIAFGVFIISCGMTHFMEIVTVWVPAYAIGGLIKLFTAIASIITAVLLIKLAPVALALPSPAQLRAANDKLQQEINIRKEAEDSLKKANKEMALLNQEVVKAAENAARIEVLRKVEQSFMQVVESAPNAMVLVNSQGDIELTNAQVKNIFGYSREELIGQPVEILIPEQFKQQHPSLRNSFFHNPISRPMGEGRDLFGLHKNGHEFPIEIGINPIDTEAGTMILASVVDLTARVKAAQHLAENLKELERRNHELDSFAFIASHDLKSPLRGIDQLATWLGEDLADVIDEKSMQHLRLMRGRINRMENLLDDLLTYSRAGHIDGNLEIVNTENLIRVVFELCCNDARFTLTLEGDFPIFVTARTPLELVMRNLINNAIKHHDKDMGEITVNVKPLNNTFEFTVADDGPGISLEHTERVFAMFQTLRSRDLVEGSGMGLAIVKKTIETLGGSIYLDVNIPRGAAFRFSWPAKLG
jgi:PAS domain S-box-containing protein